jgi:hypothetical protein
MRNITSALRLIVPDALRSLSERSMSGSHCAASIAAHTASIAFRPAKILLSKIAQVSARVRRTH